MALAKEYANIILDITKKAVAEFQPYQKMIAALLPKIIAVIKGENVSFTAEELALLKQAAAAAQRFQKWSEIFGKKSKTSLATMIDAAKNIITAAEKQAEPYIAEEQKKRQEKLEQRKRVRKDQQLKQLADAKANINNLQATHKVAVDKYNADFAAYQEELEKYNALPDKEKHKAPIAPKNPDETLIDGLTLTQLYEDLAARMTPETINNSKVQYLGNSWHCGPSAISNVVMNENPEGYAKAILELATNGKTKFFPDSKKIKLPKYLKNGTAADIKGWAAKASKIDLIFGGTIRYQSNGLLKRAFKKYSLDKDQEKLTILGIDLKAIKSDVYEGTFPSQPSKILKMCGLKINKKKIRRGSSLSDLKEIEAAVAAGLIPIVLDNDIIRNYSPASQDRLEKKGLHYLPLHGFKFFKDTDGIQKIEVIFWEKGAIKPPKILTVEQFLEGMKGYWIPEMPK